MKIFKCFLLAMAGLIVAVLIIAATITVTDYVYCITHNDLPQNFNEQLWLSFIEKVRELWHIIRA